MLITQDEMREILVDLTGRIDNEEIAGILFAVGLILTDHVYNIVERFESWIG